MRTGIASGIAVIGSFVVIMGLQGWSAVRAFVYRVFVAQYVGWPISLTVFPSIGRFIGVGALGGWLARIVGVPYASFSRITMAFANPFGYAAGTAGYLSTFWLAEAWALDGWSSLVAGCLCCYFVCWAWDEYGRHTRSPLARALYIVAIVGVPWSMLDSFSGLVANTGLAVDCLLCASCMLVNLATWHGQQRAERRNASVSRHVQIRS
ncbi:MAG: hypothetical protein ACYDH4_09005 [Candidatus Cryosericum sp.]